MNRRFDRFKPDHSKSQSVVGWILIAVVCCLVSIPCTAHPGYPASAIVQVQCDGLITIHVRHDALAFALNETPARIADEPMRRLLNGPRPQLVSALEQARLRFTALFNLTADGQSLAIELVESPRVEWIENAGGHGELVRLPIMLEFVAQAHLPSNVGGATRLAMAFPEVMGDVVLTIEIPGAEPYSLPLRAGERSPEFVFDNRGASAESTINNRQSNTQIDSLDLSARYAALGFEHIIPGGLDHMLFVLALLFLNPKLSGLLVQVTTFTVAHSVTLTLATLGLAQLPSLVIEPMIAASIALVALENLFTTRVRPWRLLIVFAFGLVHGLGFAGALSELGLPKLQLVPALVSFNVGIELGQLAVIGMAMTFVGWWRSKRWYRQAIAVPASTIIGVIGLCWTLQRCFGV